MEPIWTNPYPIGQGRAESLKVVMQAMMEGHEYDEEQKAAMRVMYKKVMAGGKKLADFRVLAEKMESTTKQGTLEDMTVTEDLALQNVKV
jgi:hypothetical protein